MDYGNNQGLRKYEREVLRKSTSHVALGQAMVFKVEEAERRDGLLISPVEVGKDA